MNRLRIQIVAGVTAAVGLAISLAYRSSSAPSTALRAYAAGTSIAVFLFLVYERYVWHWPPVRRFTHKPDLNGTWMGELRSSYERDGKPIPPIPTILRIHQTNSSQQVTLFTGESASVTEQSQMVKEPDDRWRLSWTYSNKPRASVRHRSDCHLGTAEVTFGLGDGLVGSYYTDRLTRGELSFPLHSKKLYSSVAGAEKDAASFSRPKT
jgi:hypothetical protein